MLLGTKNGSIQTPSSLTLGGYEKDGVNMYDSRKFNLTVSRVAGSFHWQVKVNKVSFLGSKFSLSERFALIDTGTSYIIMPRLDWFNLHAMVCSQV